jgi:hypothetical protein
VDADELETRADDPRLGCPYFDGGVDEMVTTWAWHLLDAAPAVPAPRLVDDGADRRTQLHGAAPEMGELIVPTLRLPADLPAWCTELLVSFVDLLVQDVVARIWDGGGPVAVTEHLERYELSTEKLSWAVNDDMFFLGMVAMEVMYDVLDAGNLLRAIAAQVVSG